MNSSDPTQREQNTTAEELPDVTMTDSGEKEPGEDPDFDDVEIDGGVDDRS